jgi:hypothetical protein
MVVVLLLGGCSASIYKSNNEIYDTIFVLNVESRYIVIEKIVREADGEIIYSRQASTNAHVFNSFILEPGRYKIDYFIAPRRMEMLSRVDTIEFERGHYYKIDSLICQNNLMSTLVLMPFAYPFPFMWPDLLRDLFHKSCHDKSNAVTLWVEDEKTGDVLAGEKWD